MTNALDRLTKASENDPNNATVLEEMAKTYESMQLFDRSNEMWRKLQEMGPAAGAAYELADQRLKFGVPTPAPTETDAANASLDAAAARKDVVGGIPDGSTFGITEVKATETPDPDADTSLTLRIGIKKQPDATIDHTKVKIQVFFYDTVGDNDIKLTDADVSYEWLTPNHDWADSNSETLAVTYICPRTKTKSAEADLAAAAAAINPAKKGHPVKASPPPEGGTRKYLGYIVRVYYNDQLQDKRAEPTKLLTLFPAPFNAPPP
jgi:hypothetical protein